MFKDTEVLTDKGWKRFAELKLEDKVASLVGEELKFVKPAAYFERIWRGQLIHFYGRDLDICVTPGHEMFVKKRDRKYKGKWVRKNWEFVRALEVKEKYRVKRNVTKWQGEDVKSFRLPLAKYGKRNSWRRKEIIIDMEAWMRFLGLWIAEGWVQKGNRAHAFYKIFVSQKKKRHEVEKILDQLPYHYSFYSGRNYIIWNKSLYCFLKDLTGSENKRIPREFKSLSVKLLKALLEGYLLGDGWISTYGRKMASTVSKQLADDLQEVGLKLGYAVTLSKHKYSNPNYKDEYKISFVENTPVVGIRHKEELDYNGKVYCVNVPSGVIYVRRNGKPVWCGSSKAVQLSLFPAT